MKNLFSNANYCTFLNFAKNETTMSTVTVKINTSTKRGEHVLGLLRELAKTGKDIQLEYSDETAHLTRSAANRKRLDAAVKNINARINLEQHNLID